MRQAIVWTNDGVVYRRVYAFLGLNELYANRLPNRCHEKLHNSFKFHFAHGFISLKGINWDQGLDK